MKTRERGINGYFSRMATPLKNNIDNYSYYQQLKFFPNILKSKLFTRSPSAMGKNIFLSLSLKAAATVEATLITPAVILFFMFFVRVIEIILVHSEMESIVYDIGNEFVTYSYVCEEFTNADYDSSIKSILESAGTVYLSETYVKSRISGSFSEDKIENLLLSLSKKTDTAIEIVAIYKIPSILDYFSENGIWLTNHFYGKPYSGYERSVDNVQYVYIAKNSDVYHLSNSCKSLNVTIKAVSGERLESLRNKDGSKYYECSQCKNKNTEIYYITDYGTKYHTDINCYEINKTVYRVPLSEVGDRRKCFYCN